MVRAELECLNCGRYLGVLIGEDKGHEDNGPKRLRYQPGIAKAMRTPNGLRCEHCGGKAMVQVA